MTQKLVKLKRKCLITIMLNVLMLKDLINKTIDLISKTVEYFAGRLKQADLATKTDIDNFTEETHFDNKLKNGNKKVTSNKSNHVLVENELDELSEKLELISTKIITKNLVHMAFLKV